MERVIAITAIDVVITSSPVDGVITIITPNGVCTAAGEDDIIARI